MTSTVNTGTVPGLATRDPAARAGDDAGATGDPGGAGRVLTDGERAAVTGVSAAVAGVALIGFVNSFAAVMTAAWPTFGPLAPTVPLGIDLGIAIFAGLDIVLARLDMRLRWVRLVPWALTAATIWLNIAGQHAWFGRVAHAVLPAMWVLAVEVGAHVVRVRSRLAAGTAMDRIRASRWLLAPARTAGLWRRMVLWEVRSYPAALARERDRVLARTALQDTWGPVAWRWKAPRRVRALYRLGELAPAPGGGTPPALAAPATAPGAAPESAPGPRPAVLPARTRTRTPGAPAARTRSAPVTGADAEREFAAELAAGALPSIRQVRARLHLGQDRARQVRAHLETVTVPPASPVAELDLRRPA